MESIKKIEDMIEGWLKPIPHLPTNWRKWISENIWWITLIGVILSVLGLLGLAVALLGAMSIIGTATVIYGAYTPVAYTGMQLVSSLVSLVLLAVTVVITAMAVKPLHVLSKKGWDLLFLAFLVGIVSQVVSAVLTINPALIITNLIGALIGAAISAYFLFEVRSYFKDKKE